MRQDRRNLLIGLGTVPTATPIPVAATAFHPVAPKTPLNSRRVEPLHNAGEY